MTINLSATLFEHNLRPLVNADILRLGAAVAELAAFELEFFRFHIGVHVLLPIPFDFNRWDLF